MVKNILGYFFVINLIGFIIMWKDKKAAIKHNWRISENKLFFIAIIGGSLGILLGMNTFRHKTKHKKFIYGIPTIIFIQVITCLYYFNLFETIF